MTNNSSKHWNKEIDKDISVYELSRHSQEFKFKKIEYAVKLYMLLGVCMAVLGLAYFLISTFNITLSEEQIKGIALFLCGILMIFFCKILLELRRIKLSRDLMVQRMELSMHSIIGIWQDFEDIGQDLLSIGHGNAENSYLSVEDIVSGLRNQNFISELDVMTIKNALRLRNKVAHGHGFIENEDLINSSQRMNEIITNLHDKLAEIHKKGYAQAD